MKKGVSEQTLCLRFDSSICFSTVHSEAGLMSTFNRLGMDNVRMLNAWRVNCSRLW